MRGRFSPCSQGSLLHIRLSFHIIFKHQMGLSMLDTVDGSEMPARKPVDTVGRYNLCHYLREG